MHPSVSVILFHFFSIFNQPILKHCSQCLFLIFGIAHFCSSEKKTFVGKIITTSFRLILMKDDNAEDDDAANDDDDLEDDQ